METTTRTHTSRPTSPARTHTSRPPSTRDRFVVGWAAGLVQVWPEEDETIGAELLAAAPRRLPVAEHRLASS